MAPEAIGVRRFALRTLRLMAVSAPIPVSSPATPHQPHQFQCRVHGTCLRHVHAVHSHGRHTATSLTNRADNNNTQTKNELSTNSKFEKQWIRPLLYCDLIGL